MATFKDMVVAFLNGEREGQSSGQGNLKIMGDTLVHYSTPILERQNGKYILNNTRYSIVTGRLQKQIKEIVAPELLIEARRVPEGYKGSLKDFIIK